MSALKLKQRPRMTVRSYKANVPSVEQIGVLPDHDIRRLNRVLRPTDLSTAKSMSADTVYFDVIGGKNRPARIKVAGGPSAISYSKQINVGTRSTKPSTGQITVKFENELDALKVLPNNWDGYGAEKPTAEAIERLTKILTTFVREGLLPARILASAMGGAGLIFTASDRVVTIQVLNNGVTTLALKSGSDLSRRSLVQEKKSLRPITRAVKAFLNGNEPA